LAPQAFFKALQKKPKEKEKCHLKEILQMQL